MRVNREGQVTIPQKVRKSMGIVPAETEVDFFRDEQGRWYLSKTEPGKKTSRFRAAYQSTKLTMSTDEIMALTRNW